MIAPAVPISGYCASGFEDVRDAFLSNFEMDNDVGAALAITLDGEVVVNLWGGWTDAQQSRPWQSDTLVNVYSTAKGVTALCAHLLADRGLLDLDAPVAKYWPEFAEAGKAELPVRWLLNHRAALMGPTTPLEPGGLTGTGQANGKHNNAARCSLWPYRVFWPCRRGTRGFGLHLDFEFSPHSLPGGLVRR